MLFRRSKPAAPPASPTPAHPLRVALDLRTWSMSGLGTYVRELLNAAAEEALPIEWTIIGPAERLRDALPPGTHVERWIDYDAPIYGRENWSAYPALGDVEIFHYPHYNLPRVKAKKKVVTVFDLFHLQYGAWHKRLYQRWQLRRLRRGRVPVITAAEKTKTELEEWAGIKPARIDVVPLGPGRPLRTATPLPPTLQTPGGASVSAPWLLAAGIDQPHKNIGFLIAAMSIYYQRRPDAPPLVWTGLSQEDCARHAAQMPALLRERVLLEPYGDAERLDSLYAGASALVFPSVDEGFGFPPLEAMARGVPVLCSRREPMTAILGEAVLYFDPNDSSSLWRALDRLLDHPGIREEIVRRGLARSAQYNWRRCALQTYEIYCRIAGRTGPPEEEVIEESARSEEAATEPEAAAPDQDAPESFVAAPADLAEQDESCNLI